MAVLWLHYEWMAFFKISSYHILETGLDTNYISYIQASYYAICWVWHWNVKGQFPDPEQGWKPFFVPIFAIFEDISMQLKTFCRGSHCPLNGLQPCCISYSFGAMPWSILAKMAIWDPNLKIGLFTTLIKVRVKVKVLDTHGVIAMSPKQFGLDGQRSRS